MTLFEKYLEFFPKNEKDWPLHKTLIFALLGFIVIPTFGQQDNLKVLTLDGAVNMALSNHPTSKNAVLNVEAASERKSGSIQFDQAKILWEYGQINSPIHDNRFLITQNFGSPFTHIQRNRSYKNDFELSQSSQKLTQKLLISKVKEAYFRWVHQISINNLILQEEEYYEELLRIAVFHFESDSSNIIEKTIAEVKYAEAQRKTLLAQEQLKIIVNALNRVIFSEEVFQPSQLELELYSIKFPENSPDKFYPYTLKNYFQQQVKGKKIELEIEKSYLFPELSAGYFHQNINSIKNLNGFQIGLSVPLWFFPQSSRIKVARINHDIALNEEILQTYELEQTIDDLKLKLDQQFINVIYMRESALEQADLLLKIATLKLQKEEIIYIEFMQSISEAMKIKIEYLNSILNYNLTAIELEYFLN